MSTIIIPKKILGDCRQKMLEQPAGSVHVICTSPPYWGMRSYLPEGHPMKHLEIGNEETLKGYLDHMLEVARACWHILRDDGTLWLNIGDRYTSGGRRTYDRSLESTSGFVNRSAGVLRPKDPPGSKKKELCMLPHRVAMALSEDGWYLRALCPWVKRNCQPESAEDRPANALEYVFMLTKKPHAYYDRFAVRIPSSPNTHPRSSRKNMGKEFSALNPKAKKSALGSKQHPQWKDAMSGMVSARNRRNTDWFMESWQGMTLDADGEPTAFVVNPKGTTIEHFAVFPPKLIEPMILASTSEAGCCPHCFKPLERVVQDGEPDREHQKACGANADGEYHGQATKDFLGAGVQGGSDLKRRILDGMVEKKTVGWRITCNCMPIWKGLIIQIGDQKYPRVPAVVCDPFHGSGTTAEVSGALGRGYLGFELNDEYFASSDARDSQTAMHLV